MTKDEVRNLPDEIRPISMWGYFGYQILFALPLIGTILLIVFALGGTRNINLRNYSHFCTDFHAKLIAWLRFVDRALRATAFTT